MSATPDGLDALMQQRSASKRAKRAMPPPRHPRRQGDTAVTEVVEELNSSATSEALAVTRDPDGSDTAPARTDTVVTSPVHDIPVPPAAEPSSTHDHEAPSVHAEEPTNTPARGGGGRNTRVVASRSRADGGGVQVRDASTAVAPVDVAVTKVKPLTVSLDERDIDWLDDLRIVGMQHRPKIDIGRSSILRLALRRLREQMTIEEIRDHLHERAVQASGSPGRRRL